MRVSIPFGRGSLSVELPEQELRAVLRPAAIGRAHPEEALVRRALRAPVGAPPLHKAARGKRRILLLTSDHTRPVPSALTLPVLLDELRAGSPEAEIRILVATGAHRATTPAELRAKFGALVGRETFLIHDAHCERQLVSKGTLPSGAPFEVNRLVDWADFLLAEGFIEPHFFAGFSGGRKAVLPGISGIRSIRANHGAPLIADPRARTGVLSGNPIHRDMCEAARRAGLSYLLNVVLDREKRVAAAFAGHPERAHEAGCAFVERQNLVPKVEVDIVLTGNGGYPLDQNIYQAVKSMTAAEACVREGGVIICAAACADGSGGENFVRFFEEDTPAGLLARFLATPPEETPSDQWQAQILARIRTRATVILVSEPGARADAERMGLVWRPDLDSALALARQLQPGRETVVIPDGVSVIVGSAPPRSERSV